MEQIAFQEDPLDFVTKFLMSPPVNEGGNTKSKLSFAKESNK